MATDHVKKGGKIMMSSIGSTSYSSYTQAPRRPDYFQQLDQDQNQSVSTDELSVMADKLSELTGETVRLQI